ncbi:MAG: M48 family metallopeptidase [Candidatus Obscuribacterales bacterium]|nr:M48 family metallopeptidase [Candidatus Obscuribacterales bacterium]
MAKNDQTLNNRQLRNQDSFLEDRASFELYQAFMVGYVRRLNEATFNVTIGGVKIGSAKYSRLAQINLHSRIITFSRFAVENVPERGRRYLVLHELAHVHEASHDKRFWGFVEKYEPDYKTVGHELEQAFKKNVRAELQRQKAQSNVTRITSRTDERKALLSSRLLNYEMRQQTEVPSEVLVSPPAHLTDLELHSPGHTEPKTILDPFKYEFQQEQSGAPNPLDWMENHVLLWDEEEESAGTVYGGCLE